MHHHNHTRHSVWARLESLEKPLGHALLCASGAACVWLALLYWCRSRKYTSGFPYTPGTKT